VEQETEGDEDEVVNVEVESGEGALRRSAEDVEEIPAKEENNGDGEEGTVFEPFAGLGHGFEGHINWFELETVVFGGFSIFGRGRGEIGDKDGSKNENCGGDEALPEKKSLRERNHAADSKQRGWDGSFGGHQKRGGRRKSKGPHGAETQVSGGSGGAVVHAFYALCQFAGKKAAEDKAESPGDERGEHGEKGDEGDCGARRFGNGGEAADDPIDGGCGGHDVAADDDHGHLHGEGNQGPKALAALNGQVARALMEGHAGEKDEDDAEEREDERIGKPAFAPAGKSEAEAGEGSFGCGDSRGLSGRHG